MAIGGAAIVAVLAVVASHTVHLLAGQMAAGPTPAPPTAP